MLIISHTKISRTMKSTRSRGGRASRAIDSNKVVQRRGASASDAVQIDESIDMTNPLFCYPVDMSSSQLKEFDKIMGNNLVSVQDLGFEEQKEVSSSSPFLPRRGAKIPIYKRDMDSLRKGELLTDSVVDLAVLW